MPRKVVMLDQVSSKRGLMWAAILVLLLAPLLAVGYNATALPGCEWCHFKNSEFKNATQATAHASVPCAGCHVSRSDVVLRGKFGLYEAFGMWVRVLDSSATDATQPRDSLCMACHKFDATNVAGSKGLRIRHASCAVGRRCVDCHSQVGHGSATPWVRVSSMSDCILCHREKQAPQKCETCHATNVTDTQPSWPEFKVTHGPKWQQTHGMGDMRMCSSCHQSDACLRCHGPGVPHASDFIGVHGKTAQRADAKCTMCHQKTFCLGCHGLEMPHPKTFAPEHSQLVTKSGRARCLRCHEESDCEGCHVRHIHPGGSVGNVPRPGGGLQ